VRRRTLLIGLAASGLSLPAAAAALPLTLSGRHQQGGAILGRTSPRARITVDGKDEGEASAHGLFVVGLDRDAAAQVTLTATAANGEAASKTVLVAPTTYDIQRIDGLPQDTVTPTAPALLERIKAEVARKAIGFASRQDDDAFATGFIMPAPAVRVSGRFGGQRILNGTPSTPHYGADLACPTGTQIIAPAAGTVSFAEPDMHYEGGLTMIDHGQGLISLYLHQSRVDVKPGDRVAAGQPIGLVGMKGRATGPHLCWRLRWHGRQMDPTLMVGVTAPGAG
jgi:murein DD-endopeptidase MepM/ murein hydrolase activator NlpD